MNLDKVRNLHSDSLNPDPMTEHSLKQQSLEVFDRSGVDPLARRNDREAATHFEAAVEKDRQAEKEDERLLALGFLQLTHVLSGKDTDDTALRRTLDTLRNRERGESLAEQIETARRCFEDPACRSGS